VTKTFYSKILLFGEYTVIDGSAAVAVPYMKYGGNWSQQPNPNKDGIEKLKKYLSSEYYAGRVDNIDFDRLERDINNGLSFKSSIPTGYGLGSSGSLSAAFFHRYFKKKDFYTLAKLKETLALIESCFHGNSSGIDPLVSYLNLPILSHPDGDIEILDVNRDSFLSEMIIIDTAKSRETAPLVEAYKHTKEVHEGFAKETAILADLTDLLITSYILGDKENYNIQFKEFSKKQLEVLYFLVDDKYQRLWKKGLETAAFYMKLCGAGGGGCMLAKVIDKNKTQSILSEEKTNAILN